MGSRDPFTLQPVCESATAMNSYSSTGAEISILWGIQKFRAWTHKLGTPGQERMQVYSQQTHSKFAYFDISVPWRTSAMK